MSPENKEINQLKNVENILANSFSISNYNSI